MKISNDVKYIGVNDCEIDLFEGIFPVKNGMSYNSYLILDEKLAIMDTVEEKFGRQWIKNIKDNIGERVPDYLIIQHMEPDHSANIMNFIAEYPDTKIVASAKAFTIMKNYFSTDFMENRLIVSDGDTLKLGKHNLIFISAPMVHWPEVIVTYDNTDKILFSADAFGKFGLPDTDECWVEEARRYYAGIIGKYGAQVQALLKKLSLFDIEIICSLHGPVLTENITYYMELYNKWSSYTPEQEGIVIAYTSVYGNTKKAVNMLEKNLKQKGYKNVIIRDVSRCDKTSIVADVFKYSKLVLATTTYNGEIFPSMQEFINALVQRNIKNRTVAFVENGSWAPVATKVMKSILEKCRDLFFVEENVKIMSAVDEDNVKQIDILVNELIGE